MRKLRNIRYLQLGRRHRKHSRRQACDEQIYRATRAYHRHRHLHRRWFGCPYIITVAVWDLSYVQRGDRGGCCGCRRHVQLHAASSAAFRMQHNKQLHRASLCAALRHDHRIASHATGLHASSRQHHRSCRDRAPRCRCAHAYAVSARCRKRSRLLAPPQPLLAALAGPPPAHAQALSHPAVVQPQRLVHGNGHQHVAAPRSAHHDGAVACAAALELVTCRAAAHDTPSQGAGELRGGGRKAATC